MKIEVKKIKHSPSLSEETNAFVADLYINGGHVGTCKNSGRGGMTDIHPIFSQDRDERKYFLEKIRQAENFCLTLPKYEKMSMSLDFFVDLEVEKDLHKKEIQKTINKLNKDCLKSIVVISKQAYDNFLSGKNPNLPYKMYGWKRPIALLPEDLIRMQLPNIKAELKGDEFIYNKNLPK